MDEKYFELFKDKLLSSGVAEKWVERFTQDESIVYNSDNTTAVSSDGIPYNKKEQPRRRFAQRIADGDRLVAAAAAPAKAQPTDDGNVLPCANQMTAVRTVARRRQQRLATRNAPHDDVQKTAYDTS